MKRIITLIVLVATATGSKADGLVNFANSTATLISVGGVAMPAQSVQQYNFAVFLAPADTVAAPGQTPAFTDVVFQLAAGYTTNHPTIAGRLAPRIALDVEPISGYSAGQTVDFVVRGWSASLGSTWSEALANWNNGNPLVPNWAIGSSTVGNDLVLGGGIYPSSALFGFAPYQVTGFNLIPEPSVGLLAGLGAVALLGFRRRQ